MFYSTMEHPVSFLTLRRKTRIELNRVGQFNKITTSNTPPPLQKKNNLNGDSKNARFPTKNNYVCNFLGTTCLCLRGYHILAEKPLVVHPQLLPSVKHHQLPNASHECPPGGRCLGKAKGESWPMRSQNDFTSEKSEDTTKFTKSKCQATLRGIIWAQLG